MTLGILLEEIKHGKEFVEAKSTVDDLNNLLDEDYNILLVSKRADQLLKECDNTKSFIKKIGRAARNYKDYENKILEAKPVSQIYARMKIDSITEDINSAITELESNKKVLRESNQEAIGKTIAALKHGLKMISEEKNISTKKINEAPGLVKSYINKEMTLIESIV